MSFFVGRQRGWGSKISPLRRTILGISGPKVDGALDNSVARGPCSHSSQYFEVGRGLGCQGPRGNAPGGALPGLKASIDSQLMCVLAALRKEPGTKN